MPQSLAQMGFTMPAEWEPHDAVWLSWPYDDDSFPDRVERVEGTYCTMIGALLESETVNLLVTSEAMRSRVLAQLQTKGVNTSRLIIHITDYADVWFRDFGPTFVTNTAGAIAMVDWEYNAYGKFPELLKDNNIPAWINTLLHLPYAKPGIVMEGGSFDVNGAGTLITTEQCLLNKNRNPHLSREQIEQYLRDYLGVCHVIWLHEGIVNDHTDGHIDDIAKFVGPRTVAYAYEADPTDPNFSILEENYQLLKQATDQDGRPLELVRLPMPKLFDDAGERLAVSYANFYIGNAVVLVPTFAQETDKEALSTIQSLFPTRHVVGIDCRDLIYGGGTIHCVTQQQPRIRMV